MTLVVRHNTQPRKCGKHICSRRNIDSTSLRHVVNVQRSEYPDLNPVDREQIRADLIQYYRCRHLVCVSGAENNETRCLNDCGVQYCNRVRFRGKSFQQNELQSKQKSGSLFDKTTTSILHVHDDTVVPNPLLPLDGKLSLRCNKKQQQYQQEETHQTRREESVLYV